MTAAEFRTLREALGLTVEACCRIFAVADRTIRRWDSGRLPVPDGVARQLLQIDADYDQAARDTVRRALASGKIEHALAVRYRTDEDLARYRPDMRLLGTQAHGALVDRVRRALLAAGLPAPRLVWLDPDDYDAWRGRRPDSEPLRVLWAASQLDVPPGTPAADSD